ncbi:MAG: hypothetical protein VCA55_16410 [Verrucomicrobiales bacterium]
MDDVFLAIALPPSDDGGGCLPVYMVLMIVVPAILIIGLLCLVVKLSAGSNKDSASAEEDQTYGEWLDDEDE